MNLLEGRNTKSRLNHDDHVHFACNNCNKTICLDDVVSPKIELPEGYIAENVQVLINGICINCS